MKVSHLVEYLKILSQDKEVFCQVCSDDGMAWNMYFQFNDAPSSNLVQLKVWHPDLKSLPSVGEQDGSWETDQADSL